MPDVIAQVTLVTKNGSAAPGSVVAIGDPAEAESLVRRGFAKWAPQRAPTPPIAPDSAAPGAGDGEASGIGEGGAEALPATGGVLDEDAAPPVLTPTTEGADSDRMSAIVDAIALLDPKNPEHFSKSGLPGLSALADILGYRPTAVERDEAVRRVAEM